MSADGERARTILCVDDDDATRRAIEMMLRRLGYEVLGAPSALGALQALASARIDLVISDMRMPQLGGMELLELMQQEGYTAPVIMLTGHGSIELAVAAMKAGAINFLTKPIGFEQLEITVEHALDVCRLRDENAALRAEVVTHRAKTDIVGESVALSRALEKVKAAATSRATVLLQGESGTGKELLARAIHELSDRSGRPFVRINCAAMPDGLIESTLFGHERGAFTGAVKRTLGAFERADGGTLLLDEITEMRLDLQSKLLRVLQEREFERVGGSAPIHVDVRIVATTNRELGAEVAAGRFRHDLFYRLNVFPIVIPPLRERIEDIPLLAHRFAAHAAAEGKKTIDGFAPDALELLRSYGWPGNVRELQHAVERAVILATEPVLKAHHFAQLRGSARPAIGIAEASAVSGVPPEVQDDRHAFRFETLSLADIERQVVERSLIVAKGNRTRAAELLGVDVRTLRRKLNPADESEGTA
ncbi:MAG TPA: sigma-54 dependent transcriptional regulator [Gemmatimonadaceae bacterium]|nr:sigma-54 dependent transcriptional regulator [Gemmatimonadaceae bacterium]